MPAREKILIVDDDRFIRMALGEALQSWNYETIEAENVADYSSSTQTRQGTQLCPCKGAVSGRCQWHSCRRYTRHWI